MSKRYNITLSHGCVIGTLNKDGQRRAWSDTAQGFAVKVLADPSKRVALLQRMPVEVYEELAYFVHAMPEHEQVALEKALGL